MVLPAAQLLSLANEFMWPFLRIGALLMAAPVFGTRLVPVRVRIALALALTFLVMPLLPAPAPVSLPSLEGLLVVLQQLLIGLAMGFALQLVFNALIIAGESMAMSMGLGFASMVDPQNGVTVPVLSQFFVILATLIFLSLDGHLALISVLVESFHSLPVGHAAPAREGLWALVAWASIMFAGALRIALPVVAALLITYLALGVMTRAAPQLNVFSVGFPITMLFGFVALLVSMPTFVPAFSELLAQSFVLIVELVTP